MRRPWQPELLDSKGTGDRWARVLILVLAIGVVGDVAIADPSEPSIADVGKAFEFDSDEMAEIREGKVVVSQLEANSDNELALSLGFLSARNTGWLWTRLESGASADPTMLSSGVFGSDPAASLKAFVLSDDELDRLIDIEPGDEVNFSTEEITRLQAAGRSSSDQKARRASQLSTLREILAERLAAYRKAGLSGIAPYDRGDGATSSPVPQLERAFSALVMTKRLVPNVPDAIDRFPEAPAPDVVTRFSWIVHEAQGRPVIALRHVVLGRSGDRVAGIERRFFVSHTLNSLQAVVVGIPSEGKTAVFYSNRTGTDQVTGFGSSVAKGVGRKIMQGELERLAAVFLATTTKD